MGSSTSNGEVSGKSRHASTRSKTRLLQDTGNLRNADQRVHVAFGRPRQGKSPKPFLTGRGARISDRHSPSVHHYQQETTQPSPANRSRESKERSIQASDLFCADPEPTKNRGAGPRSFCLPEFLPVSEALPGSAQFGPVVAAPLPCRGPARASKHLQNRWPKSIDLRPGDDRRGRRAGRLDCGHPPGFAGCGCCQSAMVSFEIFAAREKGNFRAHVAHTPMAA